MTYGTCNFVTKNAAMRYYSQYCPELTRQELTALVDSKLRDKEIVIGPPSGRHAFYTDNDGRYFIKG